MLPGVAGKAESERAAKFRGQGTPAGGGRRPTRRRSTGIVVLRNALVRLEVQIQQDHLRMVVDVAAGEGDPAGSEPDRKSTRLNSSHLVISYAVFCLKKKKTTFSSLAA